VAGLTCGEQDRGIVELHLGKRDDLGPGHAT
jgi:hypothetical protein